MKTKKCRVCKEPFTPARPLQIVCTWECGRELIVKEKEKKDRKETKERKEKLKTRSEWADDAQKAFNAYIRARDLKAGYGCISCGTNSPNIQYAAGHYRTTAAAKHLRYNEDNVHLQCNKNCNSAKAGNVVEYRINLIKRIGVERVKALENDNTIKRWTIEELKAIRDKYRLMLKELKHD